MGVTINSNSCCGRPVDHADIRHTYLKKLNILPILYSFHGYKSHEYSILKYFIKSVFIITVLNKS